MSVSRALGLTSALGRPFARTTLTSTIPVSARRFAFQSYGGGEGDPKGEKPQDQGANPSESLEHPGPPPPAEGQGTGGATKAKGERQNVDEKSSSSSSNSPPASRPRDGAQPKILNSSEPDQASSEDVERHNKEMESRHDKPTEGISKEELDKEKVSKGYWSGRGGADRQP
ncbi:MAG: hypothetical protein M1819_003936 [Sarea resinae]|nr:MAG: hypothetical protein M1819_003936 [Sarea resinae]